MLNEYLKFSGHFNVNTVLHMELPLEWTGTVEYTGLMDGSLSLLETESNVWLIIVLARFECTFLSVKSKTSNLIHILVFF